MNVSSSRKRQVDLTRRDEKLKTPKFISQSKKSDSFVEGSIVRIKLTKFLTYDSVEIRPGPQLNVIIGPNGTGKSAIVCAICLGLAGKTSWLGRATDPRDYIRHGADKARIEIELFNPVADASNYIIAREITFTKTSSWWMNGRATTQKAVEATVARLNIQVGNLCQFLPQEKVADFARMSQQELLENTEKSVGQEGMYEKHEQLKGAREKARLLETDVQKLMEQLNQEKQRNARLEPDVKSYNDRKNFLAKVVVLKMKKPWLEYNLLKEQHDRARDEKDNKSQELKQQQKQVQPLQKRHDLLKVEKEKLETETREKSQRIRSKAKDVENHQENLNNVSDKIEEVKGEYVSKQKEEESRKKRLNDLQDQLKALERGLSEMDGSDAQRIAESLKRTEVNIRNVNMEMSSVQAEGENLGREIKTLKAETRDFEAQLKQIKDVNNRRLETLRILHQNTYDAVVWLRANKDRFKKPIHEPMIICLNVANPADAKLVETHISFNDLRSFICEDSEDLDEFMRVMKTEQKLRVNAVRAPDQPVTSFKPKFPITKYKKFGFQHFMQDLFKCPDAVMRYLCLMYKVHSIPIGTANTASHSEKIINECPELFNFYTPDEQYSIKRSRYTNKVSTRNSALRDPRALADSVNVDREQELNGLIAEHGQAQRKKEDEYKVLQKKLEDMEKRMNELREERRNLMKQKEQRKSIENQITTKKQRIVQVTNEATDLKAAERKLQAQLKKIVAEKLKHLAKMKEASSECIAVAKERVLSSFKLDGNIREFSIIESDLRNAKQRFEALEREVEDLKQQVKDMKHQAREKLMEAKKAAAIGPNDVLEEQLQQRGLWEEFSNAPAQLDELDGEIHSIQARAESMFQVDEQVVREYEKREKEIKVMEESLNQRESQRHTHQEDVSRLREEWLGPLNELINRINQNFSFFFSSLQCCGEVSLNVPENPEDYEKYGVSIKVKFRDYENLRELTAHHQSGGERSVSTVLYMMALQELTLCPFRCVDEINQGMDPRNERKIFQLVVQTVCKRSTSQYFLLTPKLLPDLEYGDHMTVLCVYNGPQMMNHKEWNLKEFIKQRPKVAA
ncbi:structural maintenance of chromosomes protein 5 [Aplysia californica]|uniref:Structural maintenance of chromosomes protein 5 n=1 Tax=Aplysia californica TaxID=6500 RepID=A0ABM0JAX4_APLCA|nr:structural maintenance of chromosomes protein 5 [Aplysia californica]